MAFSPTGRAPGVYVQDTSPQGGPIAGVSTSVAAFIGVVPDGVNMPDKPVYMKNPDGSPQKDENGKPVFEKYALAEAGVPQVMTSWVEFRNKFGDFQTIADAMEAENEAKVIAAAKLEELADAAEAAVAKAKAAADDAALEVVQKATSGPLPTNFADMVQAAVKAAEAAAIAEQTAQTLRESAAKKSQEHTDATKTGNLDPKALKALGDAARKADTAAIEAATQSETAKTEASSALKIVTDAVSTINATAQAVQKLSSSLTDLGNKQAAAETARKESDQAKSIADQLKGNFEKDFRYLRYLQHAVHGFFLNGGSRCHVIRANTWQGLTTSLAGYLEKFEPIDEISMVVVPGLVEQEYQQLVVAHCLEMEDRIAILDGKMNGGLLDQKSSITDFGTNSYAAVYYPWLQVADPSQPNERFLQPPSGHVAGVCARVDATRGVHKAPANEVIQGVLAVGQDVQSPPVGKTRQGALNDKGINIIRDFGGTPKIWGARTLANLDDEPNYKYLSTRRYFNYLRESVDEGTQWVVFEPNAQPLWQRITRTIEDFLLREWRNGALFGATPKDAFYVKCDSVTNPPDVRDLGMVVTEIGVAIVKPAEFVVFNIELMRGS